MLYVSNLTSDAVLFVVLQVCLVLFAVSSAFVSRWIYNRRKNPGLSAKVKRGPQSMWYFYGTYLALTSISVALSLQVVLASSHRVFFVLLDTILITSVCFLNSWSRNKLVGWVSRVSELEHR